MLISSMIKQMLFILIFITSFEVFANELSFVIITDLHLNINKKSPTELAPKRQNRNGDLDLNTYQNLLHTINSNVKHGALQKSQFILVLGDLVSHDRVNNSVETTKAKALHLLVKHFPQQPIFYVFGNNDAINRNYGTFQHITISQFNLASDDAHWQNDFLSSAVVCSKLHKFPCLDNQNNTNGYYAAQLSNGLKLIALNSVMFSAINKPSPACDQQLNWLEQQLNSAQKHYRRR